MKKTLVIGSTVVDIIIGVQSLPKTQEDTHTTYHKMNLGGCAFNVSEILRQSKTPYVLCSPVGSGAYGDFVSKKLEEKKIPIFVKTPEIENGCCYCFVEESGERTFISHHGAEYLFSKEWMKSINLADFDSVYICGLEIEEKTGIEIVSWLEENRGANLQIYFAPGPRLTKIDSSLLARIFALNPIIHLNELEGEFFSKKKDVKKAAKYIFDQTNNTVIITLGEKGCAYFDGKNFDIIPVMNCDEENYVVDTIGAGDSHIGAFIAAQKRNYSIEKSCKIANTISKAVVSVSGASLNDSDLCFAVFDDKSKY